MSWNALRKRVASKSTQETGSSLIVILGLMLILLAFFGLAVDTAITVNARQESISSANNAIVTSTTNTGVNTQNLNYSQSRATFISMYHANRKNAPITCGTQAMANKVGGILVTPPPPAAQDCPFVLIDFRTYTGAESSQMTGGRYVRPTATATVYECSPNFFLSSVSKETCFQFTTTGRLTNVRG